MLYQEANSKSGYFFECLKYDDFFYVPHIHRHPELIYVKSGEVKVELFDHCETVKQGDFALIFPNCRHGYLTLKSSEVFVCIFSEDFVPSFRNKIKGTAPKTVKFSCRQSVTDFVEKELFKEDTTPEPYMIKSTLYAVLGEFINSATLVPTNTSNGELVDKMIKYITENYTGDISLDTMAMNLGYEKHYLSRCFNRTLKTGFSEYVNWYRIDSAKSLLIDSKLSISEIAFQCGFKTIRSFNRAFLKLTGIAPNEYASRNFKEN